MLKDKKQKPKITVKFNLKQLAKTGNLSKILYINNKN